MKNEDNICFFVMNYGFESQAGAANQIRHTHAWKCPKKGTVEVKTVNVISQKANVNFICM